MRWIRMWVQQRVLGRCWTSCLAHLYRLVVCRCWARVEGVEFALAERSSKTGAACGCGCSRVGQPRAAMLPYSGILVAGAGDAWLEQVELDENHLLLLVYADGDPRLLKANVSLSRLFSRANRLEPTPRTARTLLNGYAGLPWTQH